MPIKKVRFYFGLFILLFILALFFLIWFSPQLSLWQRELHQLLANHLRAIKTNSEQSGNWLMLFSFLYGIFHSLGPGHGKFVIASYLTSHAAQLKTSIKLTMFSSLLQGLVAVVMTSLLVVLLHLSSAYFRLSQLWIERVAFLFILLLGIQWCYQSVKLFRSSIKSQPASLQIKSIYKPYDSSFSLAKSAVENHRDLSGASCACGHQHIPSPQQLSSARNLSSQLLVILSIGIRPCSGAIFILFLSYMIDLYVWGVIATLLMSLGTGLTLSTLALIVQYARSTAVKISKWYLSPRLKQELGYGIKFCFGVALSIMAITLLYNSTLPIKGGAGLFG